MVMPSSLQADPTLTRRTVMGAALGAGVSLAAVPGWAAAGKELASLMRSGGVVVAFRHALAPGTFDPPEFRLGVCSTQRNLSDEGRSQARRTGEWFKARQLQPARVLSSPWCRCVDTATLAFGTAEVWPALGSPRGYSETTGDAHLRELRRNLVTASTQTGSFQVWVTHMFVLSDLAQTGSSSGEALILKADARGNPQVLARFPAVV
jgi:phosphohistidine phosphatase SixA